jgi:uridine phosphorylase
MIKPEARNPHLDDLDEDFLYHLGLTSKMDLKAVFGDTKYVCMGGSADRAETFANKVSEELNIPIPGGSAQPIAKTERFSMFKVGPVISINHGMGQPSLSILLNEIAKLLDHAGCPQGSVKFVRIGTSGGVGVEGGTIVIADEALNAKLEPKHVKTILGEDKEFPTKLDEQLAKDIFELRGDFEAVFGKTIGTDDFYEGQARLDGALDPGYTEEDKMDYIRKAHNAGARNFEMESPEFASFCLRAGIPAAVVCCALLNRLNGDQVDATPEQLAQYSDNAQQVVLNYIKADRKKSAGALLSANWPSE